MPFASRGDAFAARDQIAAAIDAECGVIEDGNVRRALQTLRVAIVNDARARSLALPDVTTIILPRATPAVVLAARLYDDPGLARDLVDRNAIDNPLFMPSGATLEVLAHG